jgi:hypothetical protein
VTVGELATRISPSMLDADPGHPQHSRQSSSRLAIGLGTKIPAPACILRRQPLTWARVARRRRGLRPFFANPDKYPFEDRAVAYTIAFFSPKPRGGGSFYLITFNYKDGHGL